MSKTVSPYGPDDADPYAADDTKNPHEETGDAPELEDDVEDDVEPEAPKKRGPGRPRKVAQ